jgi:hypothetical protein
MPFFAIPGGGGAMPLPCQDDEELPPGPVMALPGVEPVEPDPGAICMVPAAPGGEPTGDDDVESSALARTGARTSAESKLKAAILFFMRNSSEGVHVFIEIRRKASSVNPLSDASNRTGT